jgi:hypothetical protein
MSAPIHNVRDGVIPAIVPSAPITEAHAESRRSLAAQIEAIRPSADKIERAIADSEARAIQEAATRLQEAFHAPVIAERDQLRAALHECYAATGEEAGDIDDFRALVGHDRITVAAVKQLRAQVALDEKAKASMLREFHAVKARAEKAEAEAKRERVTWEAVDQRARDLAKSLAEAEAELREISADKLRWSILATNRGDEVQRAEAELANAKELLREIRDHEVNEADEADKFLRDHVPSELSKARTELAAERAMLDWLESPQGRLWQRKNDSALMCRATIQSAMKEVAS